MKTPRDQVTADCFHLVSASITLLINLVLQLCSACADRQEGTESDGYTEEEKLRLAQAWLQRGRRSMPGVHGDDDGEDGDIHQHTTMR